jgi:histidinol dehydrogenase
MRIIDLAKGEALDAGAFRDPPDPAIERDVARICDDVRKRGDAAIVEITRRIDGVDLEGRIRVTDDELRAATEGLDDEIRAILGRLADRLAVFAGRQRIEGWESTDGGVRFGERVRPVASVGAYAPGGRAIYPSTVVMTTVPARVAGVADVALCSPPTSDGDVAPLILLAASIAGVGRIHRIGGAQAVAALAYGTESVTPVDTIVGPGNAWVTAAKRHVAGSVGIDGLAGPSDATILSDGRADPELVAAELLAQAEHDPDSRSYLVTIDNDHADKVTAALERQASATPRSAIVAEALAGSAVVLCASMDQAMATVDRLAPEHLLILTDDPDATLARANAYGAAFLGELTSVVFGDYGGTSNHTLPTMGTARFASGLRASDFQVASAFVEMTPGAVGTVARDIEELARREGLPGHAAAIALRRTMVEGDDR